MRARVRRDGGWWHVTYNNEPRGRMRYWRDAIRHANTVAALMRRGEPTA